MATNPNKQQFTYSGNALPIQIPIGAPSPHGTDFIVQLNVKDPDAPFCFDLPGAVWKVGKSSIGAIIPAAQVALQIKGVKGTFGAMFQFGETDFKATETAMNELYEHAGEREFDAFKLVVDAEDQCFGEMIGAANRGEISRNSPVLMEMRTALLFKGDSKFTLSRSFPIAATRRVPRNPDYVLDYQDGFGPIFDCHSHWFTEPLKQPNRRRYTNCHGSCSSGSCTCRGTNQRSCWGWSTCWC